MLPAPAGEWRLDGAARTPSSCRRRTARRSPRTRSARRARRLRARAVRASPTTRASRPRRSAAPGRALGALRRRARDRRRRISTSCCARRRRGAGCEYICAIAYVDPGGRGAGCSRVVARGRLAAEPRGERGFGYDPAFLPDDGPEGLTMARAERRAGPSACSSSACAIVSPSDRRRAGGPGEYPNPRSRPWSGGRCSNLEHPLHAIARLDIGDRAHALFKRARLRSLGRSCRGSAESVASCTQSAPSRTPGTPPSAAASMPESSAMLARPVPGTAARGLTSAFSAYVWPSSGGLVPRLRQRQQPPGSPPCSSPGNRRGGRRRFVLVVRGQQQFTARSLRAGGCRGDRLILRGAQGCDAVRASASSSSRCARDSGVRSAVGLHLHQPAVAFRGDVRVNLRGGVLGVVEESRHARPLQPARTTLPPASVSGGGLERALRAHRLWQATASAPRRRR